MPFAQHAAGSASTIQLLRVASDLVAALSPSAPVDVSAGKVARDVLTALIALEGLAERRGLVMKAMLEQVGAVLQWLDPSTLYSHVLPLAIRVTASNSWQPHKRAAARIALCCARRLRTAAQRSEVCAWAAALASHPSFQMRLVFLDTLRQLISAAPPAGCSRQFLKVYGRRTSGVSPLPDKGVLALWRPLNKNTGNRTRLVPREDHKGHSPASQRLT